MPRIEEEIKQDVVDQLVWDERVNAAQINVEVDGGTVVLHGVVPSYRARMVAVEDTECVSGVERVDDQLSVQWPAKDVPSDTALRDNVELALQWNPNIDASHITVNVSDGVVSMEGSVDSLWKKLHAERLAFDVPGVIDIENRLAIVPTQKVMDETIAIQIVNALKRNSLVDTKLVDVGVSDGVVTLSGSVPNGAALHAARNAAYYTEGVIDIHDNLVVFA
jgi:hyperosmotically inducible protein